MQPKRSIVVSIDAMSGEDLVKAGSLPAFSSILARAASAQRVRSVYPSLTYPCHVSMVTGCLPGRTGIVNNEVYLPRTFPRPWHFYTEQVACPTIFDFARRQGLTTGCVMWPVMGGGPIDYLVPEIWESGPPMTFYEPMQRAGSVELIRQIWRDTGGLERGFDQPYFDDFAMACGLRILKERRPGLLYIHICYVDNAKHYHGLASQEVDRALEHTDRLLGRLLDTLDSLGIRETTALVLCSDHGQVPVSRASFPNRLLVGQGLFSSVESHSACCSALVYADAPEAAERALELFATPDVQSALGIQTVYTKEAVKAEFSLDGPFHLVLEGEPGVLFRDDTNGGPLLCSMEEAGLSYKANHGHHPGRGEQPVFVMSGPGIRPGAVVEEISLVDEPATIAQLMGFAMDNIDGRAIGDLLI